MSKNKIHIDDLFKSLKNYEAPIDAGSFEQISQKRTDSVWKSKFQGYSHPVSDLPQFEALPFGLSDTSIKPTAAHKGIFILAAILAFGLLSFSKYNSSSLNSNQSSTVNSVISNKTKLDNKVKVEELASNAIKEQTTQKSATAVAELPNQANNSAPMLPSEKKGEIKSRYNAVAANSQGVKPSNKNTPVTANLKVNREINPLEKALELPFFTKAKEPNLKNSFTNSGPGNLKTVANPTLPPLGLFTYLEMGTHSLGEQITIPNANPSTRFGWHLHTGVKYKKWNLSTGVQFTPFTYSIESSRITIYDSIPHLNSNNDTIGWFKRNIRDTSFNATNSEVNTWVIPLRISLPVLEYKRFQLSLGLGANLNFLKSKKLFFTETNGFVNEYSTQLKKFNFSGNLSSTISYRLAPYAEIYSRVAYIRGSNITNANQADINLNGIQIGFGIRQQLR